MDNTNTNAELIAKVRSWDEPHVTAVGIGWARKLATALEAAEAELTRRAEAPGTWVCIKCGGGAFEHSTPDLPSGDCVAEMHWKEAAADLSLEAAKAQASEEGYQRGVADMRASADEAHAFEEGMFEVIKHRFSGRGLGTRQAIIDAFAAFLRDPEPAAAPVSLEAVKAETTTEPTWNGTPDRVLPRYLANSRQKVEFWKAAEDEHRRGLERAQNARLRNERDVTSLLEEMDRRDIPADLAPETEAGNRG